MSSKHTGAQFLVFAIQSLRDATVASEGNSDDNLPQIQRHLVTSTVLLRAFHETIGWKSTPPAALEEMVQFVRLARHYHVHDGGLPAALAASQIAWSASHDRAAAACIFRSACLRFPGFDGAEAIPAHKASADRFRHQYGSDWFTCVCEAALQTARERGHDTSELQALREKGLRHINRTVNFSDFATALSWLKEVLARDAANSPAGGPIFMTGPIDPPNDLEE